MENAPTGSGAHLAEHQTVGNQEAEPIEKPERRPEKLMLGVPASNPFRPVENALLQAAAGGDILEHGGTEAFE